VVVGQARSHGPRAPHGRAPGATSLVVPRVRLFSSEPIHADRSPRRSAYVPSGRRLLVRAQLRPELRQRNASGWAPVATATKWTAYAVCVLTDSDGVVEYVHVRHTTSRTYDVRC